MDAVVLAVDGGDDDHVEALADAAADLAGPANATVHLVSVFSPRQFDRTLADLGYDDDARPDPDDLAKRCASVRDAAGRLLDPARTYGMGVSVHGRVAGDPGPAVVGLAGEVDADAVVVGGRERSAAGKVLFGSPAQHVLQHAPCPVTFVGRT